MNESIGSGAAAPRRVLLVDTDPQHNLTTFVGDPEHAITLADVLLEPARVREAITQSRAGSAHILNGSREIAAVQNEIKDRHKSPYTVLRRMLAAVRDEYDYIFIDTARTMDLFSVNALAASNEILVPIDCDPMAVAGLGLIRESLQELEEAELVQKQPAIRVLLTKYPGGKIQPAGVRESVEYVRGLGLPLYNTCIRYSEQARTAFPQGRTTLDLYPKSNPAHDYRMLASELIARFGDGPVTITAAIEKGGTLKTTTIATLGHALSLGEPIATSAEGAA